MPWQSLVYGVKMLQFSHQRQPFLISFPSYFVDIKCKKVNQWALVICPHECLKYTHGVLYVEQQQTVIKLFVPFNKTPSQTMTMLQSAMGKGKVYKSLVYKWLRRFSDGRNMNKDYDRSGRPKIVIETLVTSLEDLVMVGQNLGVTVQNILGRLGLNKVCAQQMLRLLMHSDKERCVESSLMFLQLYYREGEAFLNYD